MSPSLWDRVKDRAVLLAFYAACASVLGFFAFALGLLYGRAF